MRHLKKKQSLKSDYLVRPKKALGQHFLTSESIARTIVEAGKLTEKSTVYEIGPGTGILTKELLQKGHQVVAVEKDSHAITLLKERFSFEIKKGTLLLIEGDALIETPEKLGLSNYSVIANIPYFITGALIRMLFSQKNLPKSVVLLVQKEVAERIARAKKESILSLSVKAYGTPTYVRTVQKGSFNPPPRVDSAILSIQHISRTTIGKNRDEELFFELLHKGFSEKRKRLKKNLEKIVPKEVLETTWEALSISPDVRAEDVPLSLWLHILAKVK